MTDRASAEREAQKQIDAIAAYQDTENADILSLLSQLGLVTSRGNFDVVQSFRKQMIIAGAMADALASVPAAGERLWCLTCGTVTSDRRCDCNRWPEGHDMRRDPNFVNYADQLRSDCREAALEIERLRSLVEQKDGDYSHLQAINETLKSDVERLSTQLETGRLSFGEVIRENDRLRDTIDVLESNARVQATLLADTGRERDQLRVAVEEVRVKVIKECIEAIQRHYGFSDDEKAIAVAVLNAIEPSVSSTERS